MMRVSLNRVQLFCTLLIFEGALLFSEYGADLNQQVIFLNYHCFVLHSLEY